MTKPFTIAIAGLGTVGAGTIKILQENAALIAARVGRPVKVVAVSARDQSKDRGIDLSGIRWVNNPLALAQEEADCVVEVIGGAEGVARELVEQALKSGKHVVTANKALIAHHGLHLARIAEDSGVVLAFEAAVCGGIPAVKAIREGLAGNAYRSVKGIFNGTCNYILSRMQHEGKPYDQILNAAQKLGYAEADPSFDVGGIDAAHKTAILASLAFGCPPALDKVQIEGIEAITLADMQFAKELGYTIKLLGIAELTENGLDQRVHPCLVPLGTALAEVHGVDNAVVAEGDAVGTVVLEGPGAGAGATGSAIVSDIMDLARGYTYLPLGMPLVSLSTYDFITDANRKASYYVRLTVVDKSGVLAEITQILKDASISMRTFLQHEHQPGEPVQIVLTTHQTTAAAMELALARMEALETILETPHRIQMME